MKETEKSYAIGRPERLRLACAHAHASTCLEHEICKLAPHLGEFAATHIGSE